MKKGTFGIEDYYKIENVFNLNLYYDDEGYLSLAMQHKEDNSYSFARLE